MRFRLRTLLIALALGPFLMWLVYREWKRHLNAIRIYPSGREQSRPLNP